MQPKPIQEDIRSAVRAIMRGVPPKELVEALLFEGSWKVVKISPEHPDFYTALDMELRQFVSPK